MKQLLILTLLFSLLSCSENEIQDINLPESVELGESQIFLNGTLVDYEPKATEDTVNEQLIITFRFEPDQSILNSLGFSALRVDEGNYSLHETRELYIGARTNFFQTVNSEFDGWEYKLVRAEDGYFNITNIDRENLTIQGKFKAYFELESKNGFEDTGLPEKAKFEGVFHHTYEQFP